MKDETVNAYAAIMETALKQRYREAAYEDNFWVLLDALVYSENYADAVLVLNIPEQGFNYRFDARQMATLEGYEDFSCSNAFIGWQSAAVH